MENKKEDKNKYGEEILSWIVPEHEKHERGRKWYLLAMIIAFFFLMYSFFSANFLFAVIIITVAVVFILNDGQETDLVKIVLTEEGVSVGKRFFDYDDFKDFSIIYKPKQGVKNLYFEFKNSFKPRLSIPLKNIDPIFLRKNLLKYLQEDLERTDQPLSEGLAKIFKL